jgi:hypothetical protein
VDVLPSSVPSGTLAILRNGTGIPTRLPRTRRGRQEVQLKLNLLDRGLNDSWLRLWATPDRSEDWILVLVITVEGQKTNSGHCLSDLCPRDSSTLSRSRSLRRRGKLRLLGCALGPGLNILRARCAGDWLGCRLR